MPRRDAAERVPPKAFTYNAALSGATPNPWASPRSSCIGLPHGRQVGAAGGFEKNPTGAFTPAAAMPLGAMAAAPAAWTAPRSTHAAQTIATAPDTAPLPEGSRPRTVAGCANAQTSRQALAPLESADVAMHAVPQHAASSAVPPFGLGRPHAAPLPWHVHLEPGEHGHVAWIAMPQTRPNWNAALPAVIAQLQEALTAQGKNLATVICNGQTTWQAGARPAWTATFATPPSFHQLFEEQP
jgi:hypothetical protein